MSPQQKSPWAECSGHEYGWDQKPLVNVSMVQREILCMGVADFGASSRRSLKSGIEADN